jgi:hypothetical protein
MARRKRPRSESRYQRILRLQEEGKVGLLPHEDPAHLCPCPERNGPEHPDPDRPGMVGFGTCRGCRYFEGPFLTNHVCRHPKAREVAARWFTDAIEAAGHSGPLEEQQSWQAQPFLF